MSVRSHRGGSDRMHRDLWSPADACTPGLPERAPLWTSNSGVSDTADHGSDDAAGLLVARKLRERGIQARELGGEGLALLDAWSGWADVIVVDAVKSGAPPGTITIWDARTSRLPMGQFRCSTHALGVADAIELARALDRWVVDCVPCVLGNSLGHLS